jgi:hypothetical protein
MKLDGILFEGFNDKGNEILSQIDNVMERYGWQHSSYKETPRVNIKSESLSWHKKVGKMMKGEEYKPWQVADIMSRPPLNRFESFAKAVMDNNIEMIAKALAKHNVKCEFNTNLAETGKAYITVDMKGMTK